MHVPFDALDLNQLRVLSALLEEKSVTRASRRLGLTQSATSHSLARLRETFSDPLLVRSGGRLVPSSLASELEAPLGRALRSLREALGGGRPFDPKTSEARVSIATADYTAFVLVPPIVSELRRTFPGLDLTLNSRARDFFEGLGEGDYDLALGPDFRGDPPAGIHRRALFEERFVCLLRKDHPAAKKRLTPQSFAALDHAFIAPSERPGGIVDEKLRDLGLSRRVAVMIPHFLVAPFIVAQSDLVLTVPERIARTFATMLDLHVMTPPLSIPGFSINLYWHERVHHDPANRFVRETIARVGSLDGPPHEGSPNSAASDPRGVGKIGRRSPLSASSRRSTKQQGRNRAPE